jgi:hypothetical protein
MLEECVDPEQELVAQEVSVLQSIQFQRYTSCYDCGIAQQICTQWEEILTARPAVFGARYQAVAGFCPGEIAVGAGTGVPNTAPRIPLAR